MPHGTPDWGLVGPKDIVYGLDDLGEHAVRLGSPHLWDRRGDALYATCFREGLGMFHGALSGAGATVRLSTGHSRQGAYAVMLRSGVDALRYAMLHLAFPFQDPSAVGLELSFAVNPRTSEIRADVEWYDGANVHRGRVLYDHVLSQLRYWTPGGVWAVLQAGVVRHTCIRPEHTMKLVVDMDVQEYVRFLLDEQAYDMRGIAAETVLDLRAPYWYFAIWHFGLVGFNVDTYIDNVIVTQNEPR